MKNQNQMSKTVISNQNLFRGIFSKGMVKCILAVVLASQALFLVGCGPESEICITDPDLCP